MCGIVGIASGYLNDMEKSMFGELLLLSSWRGSDSTGVVTLKRNWDQQNRKDLFSTRLRKKAIDPWTFLGTEDFKQVMEGGSTVFALGHTRSPTQGAVTDENAHPFSFGNVIGVHNGTIHGKFPHRDEFETDSESLYKLINEVGIEEALREVEKNPTAAYALVFYDRKAKTLNLIRNDKRPLYLVWKDQENTLFWASEIGMIDFVLNRRGVQRSKRSGFTPFLIPPGELITFEITPRYNWVENYKRRKLDLKAIPLKKEDAAEVEVGEQCAVTFPPKVNVPIKTAHALVIEEVGGQKKSDAPFHQRTPTPHQVLPRSWSDSGKSKDGNGIEKKKKEKLETSEIGGETFYEVYNGDLATKSIILKKLHEGCAYCQKTSSWIEYQNHEVNFISHNQYLCEECATDPTVTTVFAYRPGTISVH